MRSRLSRASLVPRSSFFDFWYRSESVPPPSISNDLQTRERERESNFLFSSVPRPFSWEDKWPTWIELFLFLFVPFGERGRRGELGPGGCVWDVVWVCWCKRSRPLIRWTAGRWRSRPIFFQTKPDRINEALKPRIGLGFIFSSLIN